ncbi:Kunitz/Bovine pancreatic trypsin inhibitor domain protein [Ancylostoma caninum]|uniref:Kunitz/Bovine pancreatic trypsin inhibitor domain protein n=1 Tax=Ancylostoma caninum TaxID=29170 RepID=A0A368FYA7_ANCCA|nr:Kunitz/Bovine pancreatic trypsin inhibitor domain protein [Ancylostoma caninum]
MNLSITILCVLVCFSTPALMGKSAEDCNAAPYSNYEPCNEDNIYIFRKDIGECVQCCSCMGRNRFESEEECRRLCKAK